MMGSSHNTVTPARELDKHVTAICQAVDHAERCCLLLDYDGTLVPLAPTPDMAAPGPVLLNMLKALSLSRGCYPAIVSGRDAQTLEQWFGHLSITLVAEHGAMIRFANSVWNSKSDENITWKPKLKMMIDPWCAQVPGSFLEEKTYSLAWHYRNMAEDEGHRNSRALLSALKEEATQCQYPVTFFDGNKVLEVKSRGFDKGQAAKIILNEFQPDATVAIGDDTTDEDMFGVVNRFGRTIKVGAGPTRAQYRATSNHDIIELLSKIVKIRSS